MSLDLILNTVSASHQAMTYQPLLATKGVLVQLGAVASPHQVSQLPLLMLKQSICGSLIGGMPETQECIDFCAKHRILPKTRLVTAGQLDEVYRQLGNKNDEVIRNVLDIEASKKA